MIRIVGSGYLHSMLSADWTDERLAWTRCGIHFVFMSWPRMLDRQKMGLCSVCFTPDS